MTWRGHAGKGIWDAAIGWAQFDLVSFYTTLRILFTLSLFCDKQNDSLKVTLPTLLGPLMAIYFHDCEHQTKQMNVFFH